MEFLLKNWMLVALMAVSGGMLLWPLVNRRMGGIRDLNTFEVTRLMNSQRAVLLDVREDKEMAGSRLPKAVHIPLSQLATRVGELAKETKRPIVVYCERGNRAGAAGPILKKAGFEEVFNLAGGLAAWKDAGLPVEAAGK